MREPDIFPIPDLSPVTVTINALRDPSPYIVNRGCIKIILMYISTNNRKESFNARGKKDSSCYAGIQCGEDP